tara:strand:+ start:1563 stop:1679 length:117 start_codon:yes stop_codon:yes gene_type:complete
VAQSALYYKHLSNGIQYMTKEEKRLEDNQFNIFGSYVP